MEDLIANFIVLICVAITSFGGFGAALGYMLWEKRKKSQVNMGRQSLGQSLGLETVSASGESVRLGANKNGVEWVLGWDVRKVAGSSPRLVTFIECKGDGWPEVELRFNPAGKVEVSGAMGPAVSSGHEGLDARFVCAGDVSALPGLATGLLALSDLGDDVVLESGRLVLVCEGKQEDPTYLHQRLDTMDQIARALSV